MRSPLLFVCITVCVCVTDGDEHAQLALAGVPGVDAELNGEAGGDAVGQPRAAGSHFAGVVSGKHPKLEGAEETTGTSLYGYF